MKKYNISLLAVVFTIALCVATVLGLTGCFKNNSSSESTHTHKFEEIADSAFLKSEATCTKKAVYYRSCACGEKSSETFEYGNALNHSFTKYVSDNNATCTEDGTKTAKCDRCDETDTIADTGSKLGHEFTNYISDNNATYEKDGTKTAHCNHQGCTVTDTITDEGSKLESKLSFRTLSVNGDKVYGKVSNDTESFSFIKEIKTDGLIKFVVSLDIYGSQQVATKNIPLNEGDNVVYIIEMLDGEPQAIYEVTIRRKPLYTVNFNTNGGTKVSDQQVEEGFCATMPSGAPERNGYTFDKWYYDFSTPITKDTTIDAKWDIITYSISYNLNGGTINGENPTTYTVEDEITLVNNPTKRGYNFTTWDNGGKIEKGSVGDRTFNASYKLKFYKITYNCGNGTNNMLNPLEYTIESENIILNDAYYINADFVEWQQNGVKITEIANGSVGNVTLTAVWDEYDVKLQEYGDNYTVIGLNTDKTDIAIKSSYKGKKVTAIKTRAFEYCEGLTHIAIPDSVTSIGDHAFSGCSSLESITLPFVGNRSGVTSKDTYQYPFGYIFGTSGYSGDIAIQQYYFGSPTSDRTYATYYIPSSLKTVTITGGNILYGAFSGCRGLTSVTIGNGVTSIGGFAFNGCSGLTSITVDSSNKYFTSIDGNLYNKDKTKLIQYATGKTESPFIIPDSVTSIGNVAFSDCSGLTSITIPDSVTSIGNSAFYNCSGLTSVTIGNGVTSIGDYAFYNCSGLTSIAIPNSVTSIGYFAFSGCNGLTSVTIPDGVTSISYSTFSGCSELTSITIPDSVTSIGNWAFYNCSGLTSIAIPDSVTSIGDYAFNNCSGLTSLTIGNGVTSISYSTFSGCSGLTSVIWNAENYTSAWSYSYPIFKECSSLSNITIGANVKTIPNYAFSGCNGLTSVTIPDSVTSIGYFAFSDCSGLTSVTIPDSVTSIGDGAFSDCNELTSVTIGNGATSVGDYAFSNCRELTIVTIPDSVIFIGNYAFSCCSELKIVFYEGTEEQWNKLSIGSDNNDLTSATRCYYSETEPALNSDGSAYEGNYWHYDTDGKTPVIWIKEN